MDEPAQRVFRSAIWEFFERGASDATCRTCKMRLKTPTGSTTTLVNHLKRHPDPFKQFEKLRAAEGSKKASGPKKMTGTKTADASAASCSYFKQTLKGDSQKCGFRRQLASEDTERSEDDPVACASDIDDDINEEFLSTGADAPFAEFVSIDDLQAAKCRQDCRGGRGGRCSGGGGGRGTGRRWRERKRAPTG
ncbi:hypothetical protein MTO96_035246 [Rhipicephalus appendiculatus]